MNRRIPPEAFSYYFSLGPGRSYETVAAKYAATKRGVAEYAKRERWQERLAEAERGARASANERVQESLDAMNARHLREAQFVQSKGIEGLKSGRLELISSCSKAVAQGIQLERLIRGEPTDRTENVEQIIRREYERWLVPVKDAATPTEIAPADEHENEVEEDEGSGDVAAA